MSIDGSGVTSLWEDLAEGEGYKPRGASFSPDGNLIAYEMYPLPAVPYGRERSEIYIYNFSTGERRRLTHNKLIDSGASFSPDGSKIAFWRSHRTPLTLPTGHHLSENWDLDIYTMNTDGTNEKRITLEKYNLKMFILLSPPHFSPDGKKIVFSAYPRDRANGNSNQIYLLDADGRTKPKSITKGPCEHIWPSFSPDGSKITYVERCNFLESEIWVMEADGSHRIQLTNSKFKKESPVFSPDGKKIYFLGSPEQIVNIELWVVDAYGKNPHRIAKLED